MRERLINPKSGSLEFDLYLNTETGRFSHPIAFSTEKSKQTYTAVTEEVIAVALRALFASDIKPVGIVHFRVEVESNRGKFGLGKTEYDIEVTRLP